MKFFRSLNTRLVLSHLAVSLASIILMAVFAGRAIYQAANAEAEHNLQDLAFAAGNALELPIQEYNEGKIESQFIKDMLSRMFADNPDLQFTVYRPDGRPLVDSRNSLPPRANRVNSPEVIEALESGVNRGMNVRRNSNGQLTLHMAVLVQREIEVTAILRLSIPMQPILDAARRSLAGEHSGPPHPGSEESR